MEHTIASCESARTGRDDPGDFPRSDLAEIIEGLSSSQKALSPKFFYDDRGSRLFDAITQLPEYYLTNAELSIMRAHIEEIAQLIGNHASLIEFGSGSGVKTRILLERLHKLAAYVPVDISGDYLIASGLDAGPSTLLGKPIFMTSLMPAMTTGLNPIVVGDPEAYGVHFAGPMRFERSDHAKWVNDLVSFRTVQRIDGRIIDTDGFRALTMA